MKCLDLYAGIGGWTLGMKLSGVEHYASFEWNPESNLTHNVNFGTKTDEVDIRTLTMSELPKPSKIDIVVGSPPCTQFSFANRGGNGDIEDGLVDLHKFLTIVEYLKPKYWAMENVPRVKNIIDTLTTQHPDFRRFAKLISFNEVVNAADFGVPQARKRMICGNFPSELFLSYRKLCPRYTMGEALVQIEGRARADLLFGWKKGTIIDHHKEIPLTEEEIRINREAKLYHPIYNRMSFPDQLDRPARTVTSLCTRISRESIVITSEEGFRRLTVRERATLMGFPINFQFYGNSYSSKLKMIGNAIPPPLTYHIFNAMQHRKYTPLKSKSEYQHQIPEQEPKTTIPPVPKHRFSANRNFRFCIPGFRFGSGVRFELSNDGGIWRIRFYYGSSKAIHELLLDSKLNQTLRKLLNREAMSVQPSSLPNVSSKTLQSGWIGESECHPFETLDHLGAIGAELENVLDKFSYESRIIYKILDFVPNSSLVTDISKVLAGIMLGISFNTAIEKRDNS